MLKYLWTLGMVFIQLAGAFAQNTTDSVEATINHLFTAMKTGDTASLKNCFSSNAVMQTIRQDKEGVKVVNETVADFVSFIGKEAPGNADERIVIEMLKADGNLAVAWTPYKFFYKGKFSHCGVNSFQLVRISGQWKIQYIIDTRVKNNCQ